jgi:hypothetical protein
MAALVSKLEYEDKHNAPRLVVNDPSNTCCHHEHKEENKDLVAHKVGFGGGYSVPEKKKPLTLA